MSVLLFKTIKKNPDVILGNSVNGDSFQNSDFLDDLKSAIDATPVNGFLYIRKGTYNLTALPAIINKRINGDGKENVIIQGNIGDINISGSYIENIGFNNQSINLSSDSIAENCKFRGNINTFTLCKIKKAKFSNCLFMFEGTAIDMIAILDESADANNDTQIIENCKFVGNGNLAHSSVVGFIAHSGLSSARWQILGNRFENLLTTGTNPFAIKITSGRAIITNNYILSVTHGILVYTQCIIHGNILNNTTTAIESTGSSVRTISNNGKILGSFNITGTNLISTQNVDI